jgi:hypothetical protein
MTPISKHQRRFIYNIRFGCSKSQSTESSIGPDFDERNMSQVSDGRPHVSFHQARFGLWQRASAACDAAVNIASLGRSFAINLGDF